MNSNLFQTILTVLLTLCGVATTILLSFGCTQDAAGAVSCAASSASTWLAPYLVIAASALGIVKLITGAFTGKLMLPTVAVTKSGAAGTVHPDAMAK